MLLLCVRRRDEIGSANESGEIKLCITDKLSGVFVRV